LAAGYAAAKDRTFSKFEIWRRQATGTVAEILGENEIEASIAVLGYLKYRGESEQKKLKSLSMNDGEAANHYCLCSNGVKCLYR